MAAIHLPAGAAGAPRRALVYARTGPPDSGPDIGLQLAAAAAHARLSGFEPVGDVVDEGVPGTDQPFSRAGLGAALKALSSGEVEALSVSAVDRISSTTAVTAGLVDSAVFDGWKLLVPGVADCSTPAGRFAVTVLCALTRLVDDAARSQDTRAASAAADPWLRYGPSDAPVPLPAAPHHENVWPHPGSYLGVWIRAIREHGDGVSVNQIALDLNDDGVPLPGGLISEGHVEWTRQSVSRLVEWPEGVGLLERAMAESEQGCSPAQIARSLRDDGIPTRRGRTWNASRVTALLDGKTLD